MTIRGAVGLLALGLGCAPRAEVAVAPHARTAPIAHVASYDEWVVEQREGVVYWVLPGRRALTVQDFGTPTNPLRTATLPPDTPEVERDLVGMVPYLVGVPPTDRLATDDGQLYTTTRADTPFGDDTVPVGGTFRLTARDRRGSDDDRRPLDTPDQAELTASFISPEGVRYDVVLTRVVQPPIPGWETGGGVVLGGWIGGDSGADSPLAPRTWAWAAVWGVADVLVDGEVVDRDKLVRIATTEPTRDRDNRLVASWELPLSLDRTSAGRLHQTSLIVWPVRLTADGPIHEPLAVRPGDTRAQPFVHVVFEGARIVRGPAPGDREESR